MIDFRYHIVSIIAIFLALGLGVVAGTTVLDRVTVDALRGRVDDLRGRLDAHRQEVSDLRTERDRADDLIEALAPHVTEGVLVGLRVLFVSIEDEADWHASVKEAITEAGAENVGSIAFTPKWALTEAGSREELLAAFEGHALAARDIASAAAGVLGELVVDDEGVEIVRRLTDAGFMRTTPSGDTAPFPPRDAHIVILSSDGDDQLAAFARGAASVTPTLGVASSADQLGSVGDLRRLDDPPTQLATFDAAGDDPAGVGTVLALRAAANGTGGHFGRAPGLRFLPAPS